VINVICDNALIGGFAARTSQSRRQWSTTCAAISTFAPPHGPLHWNTHRQSPSPAQVSAQEAAGTRGARGCRQQRQFRTLPRRRSGSLSFRARHDISLRDSRHRDHSGSARRMGTSDDTSARAQHRCRHAEHHEATGSEYHKAAHASSHSGDGAGDTAARPGHAGRLSHRHRGRAWHSVLARDGDERGRNRPT
jgi:hypothetical protein